MLRSDVHRLKVGDRITFGDHSHVAKCSHIWEGIIKHITYKGGILVAIQKDGKPAGEKRWVCYAHVITSPAPDRIKRRKKRSLSAY